VKKIKKIHQKIRSVFLSGSALSEAEKSVVISTIAVIEADIERLLLELENYSPEKGNQDACNDFKNQVLALQHHHLILSDLVFCLKTYTLGGREWQNPKESE